MKLLEIGWGVLFVGMLVLAAFDDKDCPPAHERRPVEFHAGQYTTMIVELADKIAPMPIPLSHRVIVYADDAADVILAHNNRVLISEHLAGGTRWLQYSAIIDQTHVNRVLLRGKGRALVTYDGRRYDWERNE